MDPERFLEEVRGRPWYQGQVVHTLSLPRRDARFSPCPLSLHPLLQERLRALGVTVLYSHQAQAVEGALRGENIIVSTPAASGKSLCYHLPVLHTLLQDRTATALYLYPAKALAQDQLRFLGTFLPPEARIPYAIYDGDTPERERPLIRRSVRLLLTNPDMLHIGVLPHHRSWARFLMGLRFVVLDEAHTYRGVFGSHTALLLRRLRRLCARYGSSPVFLLASATLGNPREMAEALLGLPVRAVTEDGSPFGGKTFALWNPPLEDPARGKRRSPVAEAALLLGELVKRGVRTLAFVRTRRMAELVYIRARDFLRQEDPRRAERLAPYRATYLPEDRRRIERDLFEGRLLGVSATNALELGIDIGDLDATLLTGYPGSIASTWQQAGRSGRRGEPSLSLLIGRDDPLDQFLMSHPEFLLRPPEHALLAPDNPYILAPHLLCAAYEAPLEEGDASLFGPTFTQRVRDLEAEGLLVKRGERWHLSPSVPYPAEGVNLRSTSPHSYLVVEEGSGRVLEEGVEEGSAFRSLHPGAVYLHQGEPYLVTRLDLSTRTALVRPADVPYYTQSREVTDTRVLRVLAEKKGPAGSPICFGEVEVTTQVVAFSLRSPATEEVLGEEGVDLPPLTFRTTALWFEAPEEAVQEVLSRREDLAGGLHALEHCAIGVLPLFALCDRNDIGGVSTPLHPDTGTATVFIHDGHPGGIGIAQRGFEAIEDLWRATLEVLERCPCEAGCPACIQSPKCGNNNHPLDKGVARLLLRALLARWEG